MPKPKIKTRKDKQIEKFVKYLEAEDRLRFDKIRTPKYSADVETLLTYDMDIKKILTEQILKDMGIPKALMEDA